MAALEGRVFLRFFGGRAARWSRSASLRRASWRLRSWLRYCCASIRMTPSSVARLPAYFKARWRTSSGREGECLASKRSRTAVEVLLTCWPPGPELRINSSSSSSSGMAMPAVIRSIPAGYGRGLRKRQRSCVRVFPAARGAASSTRHAAAASRLRFQSTAGTLFGRPGSPSP